jgi:hypothetical protein
MRLKSARVQKHRSIIDTNEFVVEEKKTILAGPNEAGKTVLLQALQQVNAPADVPGFTPLRDYPRALYNDDLATKKIDPKTITVVDAEFALEAEDKDQIPSEFHNCTFCVSRSLGNTSSFELKGGPRVPTYGSLQTDLTRLAAHVDGRASPPEDPTPPPSVKLKSLSSAWDGSTVLDAALSASLLAWLREVTPLVDEANENETKRLETLTEALAIADKRSKAIDALSTHIPVLTRRLPSGS